MPLDNVNALDNKIILQQRLGSKKFYPDKKIDKQLLNKTLPPPEKHPEIPENAHWLSGEGAGSWFVCYIENNMLKVSRFSPGGKLECSGSYANKKAFELIKNQASFSLSYPSNCHIISLRINNENIPFYKMV